MLILTSGYNRFFILNTAQPPTGPNAWYGPASNEYVFVYDISTAPYREASRADADGLQRDVFDPSGAAFYTGGCAADYAFVVNANPTTGAGRPSPPERFP